jgi:hypothetical protein
MTEKGTAGYLTVANNWHMVGFLARLPRSKITLPSGMLPA